MGKYRGFKRKFKKYNEIFMQYLCEKNLVFVFAEMKSSSMYADTSLEAIIHSQVKEGLTIESAFRRMPRVISMSPKRTEKHVIEVTSRYSPFQPTEFHSIAKKFFSFYEWDEYFRSKITRQKIYFNDNI